MKLDHRDPAKLGEELLEIRALAEPKTRRPRRPLSTIADEFRHALEAVADYDSNPSTIEKYGRPQDRPEGR